MTIPLAFQTEIAKRLAALKARDEARLLAAIDKLTQQARAISKEVQP